MDQTLRRKLSTQIFSIQNSLCPLFCMFKYFLNSLCSKLKAIKEVLGRPVLGLCMSGGLVDPLFFYTDVINDYQKCIELDKSLAILACVLRTINDSVFIIYLLYIRNRRKGSLKEIGTRVLIAFLVWAILPLPQVLMVIALFIPRSGINGRGIVTGLLVAQNVYRLIPLVGWTLTGISTGKAISGGQFGAWLLMFCFYSLYFSLITGVIGYSFAISAETNCWRRACIRSRIKSTGSNCHQPFSKYYCSTGFKADQSTDDTCSINREKYDFGMFEYVHQSGFTHSLGKILYALRWGLQSLSSFGQSLEPDGDAGRNIFTIFVILFGMLLFSFLIGLLQMYLQSYSERHSATDAMDKKRQVIEQWRPLQNLSEDLKLQITKCMQDHMQNIKNVVNIEDIYNNLPEEIRGKLTRELSLKRLYKVKEFARWRKSSLEELCKCLKPVVYVERTRIVREGDQIDEMIFVVQGKLWSYTKFGSASTFDNTDWRILNDQQQDGDFCGNELVDWLSANPYTSNLPISTRTIQAVTNVEALVLMAYDLKNICMTHHKIAGLFP